MILINSQSASTAKERIKDEIIKLFKNFLNYKQFSERPGQTEMLSDVLDTILHSENSENLAILGAQAPTGTGKTFAYGFAILSLFYLSQVAKNRQNQPLIIFENNKVIISTVSIVLQDQLIKDIEDMDKYFREYFGKNKGEIFSVARVLGKDNIICPSIADSIIDGSVDIPDNYKGLLKSALAKTRNLNKSGSGEELKFKDLNKTERVPSQFENKVCCTGIGKTSCRAINAPCSYRNNYQNLLTTIATLNKSQIFLINHSLHNTVKKGLYADAVIFDEADMYSNKVGQENINITNYLGQLNALKNKIEGFIEATISAKRNKLVLDAQDSEKILYDMKNDLSRAFNLSAIEEKMQEAEKIVKFVADVASQKQQFLPSTRSSIFVGGNITQYAKVNKADKQIGDESIKVGGGEGKSSKRKKPRIILNSNRELVGFMEKVYDEKNSSVVEPDLLVLKFKKLIDIPALDEHTLNVITSGAGVNNDYIKSQYNNFVDFYKKQSQSFDFLVKKILGQFGNNKKFCVYFDVTTTTVANDDDNNNKTLYNVVFRCDEVSLYNTVNIRGTEGSVIATSATLSKLLFNNIYKDFFVNSVRNFKSYNSNHNQQNIIIYSPHKGKHSIYNTDSYDVFLKDIAEMVVNAVLHRGNTSNSAIITYNLFDKEKIEEYIREILKNNSIQEDRIRLLSTKDYSMYEIIDKFKKKQINEPNIISVFGMDGSKGIDLSNYSCSLLVSIRAPFPQPHNPAFYEIQREFKEAAKIKVLNDTINLLVQTGGRTRGHANSVVVYALPYTEKKVGMLMDPIIEEMEDNNKIYVANTTEELNETINDIFDKVAQSNLLGIDNIDAIGVTEKVIVDDVDIFK